MNDEIKEILDEMLWQFEIYPNDDFIIKNKESRILLDYITNLQQENERLKENAEHNDKVVDKARWNEMIYKSRCEKASEILHNLNDTLPLDLILSEIEHSENILQNGGENDGN